MTDQRVLVKNKNVSYGKGVKLVIRKDRNTR